jgi:hypothetical protein
MLLKALLQFPAIAAQPEIQVSLRATWEILKNITLPDDFDDRDVAYLAPEHYCLASGQFSTFHSGEGQMETLDLVEQRVIPIRLRKLDMQVGAKAVNMGALKKRPMRGAAEKLVDVAVRFKRHRGIVLPD